MKWFFNRYFGLISIFFILSGACQDDNILNNAKLIVNYTKKPTARISFNQNGNQTGPFENGNMIITANLSEKLETPPKIEIKQSGKAPAKIDRMNGSGKEYNYIFNIKTSTVPEEDLQLPVNERECSAFALSNALQTNKEFNCPAEYKDGDSMVNIFIGNREDSTYYSLKDQSFQVLTTPSSIPEDNSVNVSPLLDKITITFKQDMDIAIIPSFTLAQYPNKGNLELLSFDNHELTWSDTRTLIVNNIPNNLIMLPENMTYAWILGNAKLENGKTFQSFYKNFSVSTHPITFKTPSVSDNRPADNRFLSQNPVGSYWIVEDQETGLVWTKCLFGSNSNAAGDDCLDSPSVHLLGEAMGLCNTLNSGAGYGNKKKWHIPTIKELMTLASYDSAKPFHLVNTNSFPKAVAAKYLTITFVEDDPQNFWTFNFSLGLNEVEPADNLLLAHCVDSSNIADFSGMKLYEFHPTLPSTHTDKVTGKDWYQMETIWYGGLSVAQNNCDNATTTHRDDPSRLLRLPDIYELMSLARFSKYETTFIGEGSLINPLWSNRQLLDGYYSAPNTELYYTYSFTHGIKYHESHPTTQGYILCIVNPKKN